MLLLFLGFVSQWFAWGFRFPSIVLLFAAGFVVGPVLGLFVPDQVFGELLFPIVSALIGVILFEGGLSLEIEELGTFRGAVTQLILIGGAVTFVLTALLAYYILGFQLPIAVITGGILVVTGPTVVIPLLQQIRPQGDVGNVARWEGIIIDPFGALLAVIVFSIIVAGYGGGVFELGTGLFTLFYAVVAGTVIGLVAAYGLVHLLDRYWIPDHLHNFAILSVLLCAQALANLVVYETGLMTVTVMGMYMANQNRIKINHIIEFKEELRTLFISALFIILVARLDMSFITGVTLEQILFLGGLIFFVRPVSVLISTAGTDLNWSERGFLSWLAPRGIVAAAMASLFAEKLSHLERFARADAMQIADITFLVIAGTVLVYGFTLDPVARWLGLAEKSPQGILFIGAHEWARSLAGAVQEEGIYVRMVDKSESNLSEARARSIDVTHKDVLNAGDFHRINVQQTGYLLAVTPNDEANTLSILHGKDLGFSQSEVYQISPSEFTKDAVEESPEGRIFMEEGTTFDTVQEILQSGGSLTTLDVGENVSVEDLREQGLIPMVLIRNENDVTIVSEDTDLDLQEGDRLIALQTADEG